MKTLKLPFKIAQCLFLMFLLNTLSAQEKVQIILDSNTALEVKKNSNGDAMLSIPNNNSKANTALGDSALYFNTVDGNTALGSAALVKNTTGRLNTAAGAGTLNRNLNGNFNTAFGAYTMEKNISGGDNVAIGITAGYENISGSANTLLGNSAMYHNTLGSNNVALGNFAGINAKGNGNIFLGNKAGESEQGSDKLYIHNNGDLKDSVLIYGEFDAEYLRMNASMEVFGYDETKPSVKGIKQYPNTINSDQPGVLGQNTVVAGWGVGVEGDGNYRGVYGRSRGGGTGVFGTSEATGVFGFVNSPIGTTHFGVQGNAQGAVPDNVGVYGIASGGTRNFGVYGAMFTNGADDYAGYFQGKVKIDGDFEITGNMILDSIDVNQITGILGNGHSAVFPVVLDNTAEIEITGILDSENLLITNSIGFEIDTFTIAGSCGRKPLTGFNAEFPLVLETADPTDIAALQAWFATPSARSLSVIFTDVAGIETSRVNMYEYVPDVMGPGSDGRTSFTLKHNLVPDAVAAFELTGDFGNDYSWDPATDKKVEISGVNEDFAPAVQLDTVNKVITLEMTYNEGAGLYGWIDNFAKGVIDVRFMSIIETTDGVTEISRENFFEVVPFKYEIIYGFGLNTKLKARVMLKYECREDG